MQLQAISLGFTDAQWTSFPSFCQRCYSSLTELLTEMGHYTEAIKRYLTILASSHKKAKAISAVFGIENIEYRMQHNHFQLWGEMIELLVSKAKDINTMVKRSSLLPTLLQQSTELLTKMGHHTKAIK